MNDHTLARGRSFVLRYYEGRRKVLTATPRDADPVRLFSQLALAAMPEFARWVAVVDRVTNTEFSYCVLEHEHSLRECTECWTSGFDVSAAIDAVISTGESLEWPDDARGPRGMISQLVIEDRPAGAVLFVRDIRDASCSEDDLRAVHDVVTALGVDLERLRLRFQSRLVLRASQRVASQLHQLISASLTVGTLDDEAAIAQSLARSARSVFEADHAILTLGTDDDILVGSARRGRAPRLLDAAHAHEADLPEAREHAVEPWSQDDWLCAPVLDSQRRTRGMVAARRSSTRVFSDEDRELAMLLGQLAATSIEALELNRQIHDNETRLRILVDAAPVSIVESDATGRVRWWNHSASRLLRWPEFTTDSIGQVDWPDEVHAVLATLWKDVLVGGIHDSQEFAANISGRDRLLAGSVAALPSGDVVPNILTLLDDITDQRELREEVRHAHQMELRGQVASSVAHDFNNLITLILGYTELLSRHVAGDEKSKALVDEIQATSSRASRLTTQLQSIGRTASPAPVRMDIAATLQRNAEVLERIMGPNTSMEWMLAEMTPEVTVDADLFEQMILNLCINARDAMPDGGRLTLRTEVHELSSDDTRSPNGASGTYVTISITDTGIGMDDATRARCFEPLFTTKGPFKGTGLGLASARRLVEESGGVIMCDSLLGVGTTFTVWLPANEPPIRVSDDDPRAEASGDDAGSRRKSRRAAVGTVLLCEDDNALRHLALHALQRNGLTVLEAVSGEEALEILTRFDGPIDVLVSDVVLPEMTGQQLAERLQRDRPDLMIALMSGTASPEVIDGLAPGSAVFIAKPFRPSELLDHVFGLLERRTPSAS